MKLCLVLFIVCQLFNTAVHGWDTEELEVFDLVEEINKNFYEFMKITQNATTIEIKRAFRGLSIQLHPDKNPSEDANIEFRNLVSIYEVLKDKSKREKYDKVLRDGMPNWKSALYYYRRMRKIGLYEGAGIIFLIITVGQYLFAWAAYFEKRYTAEQVVGSKLKKLQKKNKNIDMDSILNGIPLPSLKNTLPIQIPLVIWKLPSIIRKGINKANEMGEMIQKKRREELEESKRQEELEREYQEQARLRKEKKEQLRKRKQNAKAPEKTEEELKGYSQIQNREFNEDDIVKPVNQRVCLTGTFWTDEDLIELARLIKKYPGGLGNRWIAIAENMNRSVQEVTFMAAKIKENGFRIPGQTENIKNDIEQTQTIVKKEKTKKDKNILIPEKNWSQEQQKALETAIIKYRRTVRSDKWQKIASCVPDKTKEECLIRYKYLCELVKAQKINEESESNSETITNKDSTLATGEQCCVASVRPEELADSLPEKSTRKRMNRRERNKTIEYSSDETLDNAYVYQED